MSPTAFGSKGPHGEPRGERRGSIEIYADHAATTPLAPEVLEAMRPYFGDQFGNASSVHRRGEAARDAIQHARAQVASLIGATPEEIVFTATGSEANNLALRGALGTAAPGRRRLIVTAIEHPSVLETVRALEREGAGLTVLPVDSDGLLDPDRLQAALAPDVALVSVMAVNNEIGVEQPIAELASRARAAGARFHTDAVQAAGKRELSVTESGVDLLSLAGHKLHGPLGAAALFVRRRVRLTPLVLGGHQERGRRAGTENLPAIVGLGAAAERAWARLAAGGPARDEAMGERLRTGLESLIPRARLNGHPIRRVRSIVNLSFEGVDGEAVLHELDRAGITVSTGSACSAASPGPSHVLMALGLRPEDAHASVRFSLGEEIAHEDVDTLLATVPPIVARLRALGAEAPVDAESGASWTPIGERGFEPPRGGRT